MIYILYILCAIVFAKLLWRGYYLWKYRSIRHIPGPTPLPLIGNLLDFLNYTNALQILNNYTKKYGTIITIQGTADQRFLLVSDVELTEFILRSPKYIKKSEIYHFIDPWLGNGILQADGHLWHKQRKMATPAFHFKILEAFLTPFDTSCDILIDLLSEKKENEFVDILPLITAFTLDIIAETAMGTKINAQLNPYSEYVEAVDFITSLVVSRTLSIWKRFEFLFRFTSEYKKQTESIKILSDLTYKIIAERKQILFDEKSHTMEENRKHIFLDILLNTPIEDGVLTDEDIKDAVNSFMFGGHDTTASAISFILYALANNPDIQEKIIEELNIIYGTDSNRPVTMQDLQGMKYMDLVIKETLRFYTPVPIFGRQLIEDVNYNGTILPEGLQIIFFTYAIHNNPEIYKNPEQFNPERFLTETAIKPYTFLPFSAGPRNCMGQKYAMYELKVTIAKLLRRFEFSSAGPQYNVQLYPQMVMKSLNGVHLKIKKRVF